jgi:uncharacterized protein (DUF58 family)
MSFQFLTLVTCAAGMALVGLVYNAIAVHFMVGALIATLIVSYASSRLSARALDWKREAADRVFEHEPMAITVELTNRGRLPRFLLTVADRLPEHVRSDQLPEFVLPALWPGERVKLSYQAYAVKRGVYSLGPLRVSVSDPFGVFQRFVPFQAIGEAVVYPRPVSLTALEISDTVSDPAQSGGERSQAAESGLEFYGVRDYQPGDELRRIHWPATAHHNRLSVIEFERGASRSLTVVLDAAAGSEFGAGIDTTLEVGIRIAASLVHWALEHHGYASLAFVSASGPHWVELERLDQEWEALEQLARLQADGAMPISHVVEWAGARIPTGGSVCVVTCAPDPRLPAAIGLLTHQQIRVAAALVDPISFDARAPRYASAADLEVVGASAVVIRRGEDLQDALSGAFITGS